MAEAPAEGCSALPHPLQIERMCSTGDLCPCGRRGREAGARACTLRCTASGHPGERGGGAGGWRRRVGRVWGSGGCRGRRASPPAGLAPLGYRRWRPARGRPREGLGAPPQPPRRGSGLSAGAESAFAIDARGARWAPRGFTQSGRFSSTKMCLQLPHLTRLTALQHIKDISQRLWQGAILRRLSWPSFSNEQKGERNFFGVICEFHV